MDATDANMHDGDDDDEPIIINHDDGEDCYYPADEQAPDDESSVNKNIDDATYKSEEGLAEMTLESRLPGLGRHRHRVEASDQSIIQHPALTPAMPEASLLHEDDTVEHILRNQSPTHSVRMALTYLLLLFVSACTLTLIALPAYHLLLGTVWIVLFAMFAGLVWFIQNDVIHKRALHPYVHAAYDAVVRECRDFCSDWRMHVLLLTNGNEDDVPSKVPTDDTDEAETTKSRRRRPKIKSKLFKVVVKPFLPLLKRRKRKSNNRDDAGGVVQANEEENAYVPAPDGSVIV